MNSYIAIFRGINVGKGRKVPMVDLEKLCEALELQNVQTYIQSGNVVFELIQPESFPELETRLQKAFSESFGFDVPVIVRTAAEWAESIANNPFWKEKDVDIDRLHLTFLRNLPDPEKLEKVKAMAFPPDKFEINGKDVFVFCYAGYSDSKLTNQFFESKLGTTATTRNWKTVMKLHEMVSSNV